jgi:hypothetical protein
MLLALFSFTILIGARPPLPGPADGGQDGAPSPGWERLRLGRLHAVLPGAAAGGLRLRPRPEPAAAPAGAAARPPGILALAAVALPVHLPAGWEEPGAHPPRCGCWRCWCGRSASLLRRGHDGPLLQAWFARSGHRQAGDPYFLYAASNLGSLAGLLAYPFLMEPLLPLARGGLASQSGLWAAGYGLYAAGVLGCGFLVRTAAGPDPLREDGPRPHPPPAPASGCCSRSCPRASSSAPRRPWGPRSPRAPALGAAADRVPPQLRPRLPAPAGASPEAPSGARRWSSARAVTVGFLWAETKAVHLLARALLLSTVFTAGRRAARKAGRAAAGERAPRYHVLPLEHALGGVPWRVDERPGGAPRNLRFHPASTRWRWRWPCLLAGERQGGTRLGAAGGWTSSLPLALAGVLAAVQAGCASGCRGQSAPSGTARRLELVTVGELVPRLDAAGTRRRRIALALVLVTAPLPGAVERAGGRALPRAHVLRGVPRGDGAREADPGDGPLGEAGAAPVPPCTCCCTGSTRHGSQLQGRVPNTPTGYYHPSGPFARVFGRSRRKGGKDVAVVGLGTGTLALYASPRGRMTYYEIDPAVVAIARDPRLFTFLGHAPGPVDVEVAVWASGGGQAPRPESRPSGAGCLQRGRHPGAPADAGGLRPLRTEAAAGCGDRRAHLERLPRPRARAGGPGPGPGDCRGCGWRTTSGTSSRRRNGRSPARGSLLSGDGGSCAGPGRGDLGGSGALPRGRSRAPLDRRPLGPRSARSTGIEPALPQHAPRQQLRGQAPFPAKAIPQNTTLPRWARWNIGTRSRKASPSPSGA